MLERGKVIKVYGDSADVEVSKKDECAKCGLCAFPKGADKTIISATNQVNAKVGDTVNIKAQKDLRLTSIILVFLVPLLLIGVAVLINHLLINVEIWILILSVIFIILWYTILAIIDKKVFRSKNYCHIIESICTEKVNKNDTGNNE